MHSSLPAGFHRDIILACRKWKPTFLPKGFMISTCAHFPLKWAFALLENLSDAIPSERSSMSASDVAPSSSWRLKLNAWVYAPGMSHKSLSLNDPSPNEGPGGGLWDSSTFFCISIEFYFFFFGSLCVFSLHTHFFFSLKAFECI